MSYVLIYDEMRLDLDDAAMRDLKLRPGQHVPNDMVAECIRAQARQVCKWRLPEEDDENMAALRTWANTSTG